MVQMRHLTRHLGIGPLTLLLLRVLGLRLTLTVLTDLRCLEMAPQLLGAEPEEVCVLIVHIGSAV